MAADRYLTAHLNDGSKISIVFEQQTGADVMAGRVREAIDAGQLAFEADGDLFIVPMTSIKYVQVHPAPEKMPNTVIRGARLVTA